MLRIVAYSLVLISTSAAVQGLQDSSSFRSPGQEYRPKFRYWLPDASVSSDVVQQDIANIAEVGCGGLELVPCYQYGLPEQNYGAQAPTDWSIWGFGTEAWQNTFLAALKASRETNLLFDFSLGASEGQGVPSEPETPGLAVELAHVNFTLAAGETFNGTLPLAKQPTNELSSFMHDLEEFGEQTFHAVLAAEVIKVQHVSSDESTLTNTVGSIIDLRQYVTNATEDGRVNLDWTAPSGNSTWRIIAFYERYANQRSVAPGWNPTNYIQNGSWIVDHFSANGSKMITDFFEQHVIPSEEAKSLLTEVGNYAWEDSMEMLSALWWTPGFADRFLENRGYSIAVCLPLLIEAQNYWDQLILPYAEKYESANATSAVRCSQDYQFTLNEGYQAYLEHFESWAHSLGLQYSAQPAYNMPLNMLDDIPILDAPEGESLGFQNLVDAFRQFSGPAHLTGKTIISSECGAVSGAPYWQTLNELLWSVRRGIAGGVSMNVLHGYAYSGEYANTTWPSYTTFQYKYSEMWNPNQPTWRHMNDSMAYIARNQYISQIGTPKVDVAFYLHASPWQTLIQYNSDNLENLGYTYEYLGSGNLAGPNATVTNKTLAFDGPAYKALVFQNQYVVSPQAANRVKKFAEAGLPLIFVGETEFSALGQHAAENQIVADVITSILGSGLENVQHINSTDDLPQALATAGVLPRVSFSPDTTDWYSFWRQTNDTDYIFLYNDGTETQTNEVAFTTLEGTHPFYFDTWTGDVAPILQYTANSTTLTIPVTLVSNQTTIIGLSRPNATSLPAAIPRTHITNTTGAITAFTYTNNTITAHLTGPASIALSSGTTKHFSVSAPPPSNLSSWDIVIEDWHATTNRSSMETAITYHNYTGRTLAPWTALDTALANVSGIGTYRTTFSSPPQTATQSARHGAILHLGPVTNTIRAWVNGAMVQPIDLTNAVVDVSGLVREGRNEVVVEVATTLFNRVKAEWELVFSAGDNADSENSGFYEDNGRQTYGLLGPVWVEWAVLKEIA